MPARAHNFGTNIRGSIDAENFRKAARSVGADLRYWVSMGTVATVDTETGEWDPTDGAAIWNASDGIDVDVRLEPLDIPVTCRYAGISAGDVTIFTPIRPGYLVKVEFPDGDLTGGVISAIIQSRSNRQPTDGGKPIFGNDRVLIHAASVPVDIRTAGGAQVLLDQQGNATVTAKTVKLGDSQASQHVMHAELFTADLTSALSDILSDLTTVFSAVGLGPPQSTDSIGTVVAGITAGIYRSTKVSAT